MRTLVLNASYEPLAVVSFRRALVLVLTNKATMLAADADPITTNTGAEIPRPRVILLQRYVRVPYHRNVPVSRRGVLRRDGHRCAYCEKYAGTVDHVMPRSRGGGDTWENLVACCVRCNNIKGDRTLSEMGWTLSFRPQAPAGATWLVRGTEQRHPLWVDYLPEAA